MSDDGTWYPVDPYAEPGVGDNGRASGYRGRRGNDGQPGQGGYGDQGGRAGYGGNQNAGYDPYARGPQYDRPAPQQDPNQQYGRNDRYGRPVQGPGPGQGQGRNPGQGQGQGQGRYPEQSVGAPYRIDPPTSAAPPRDPYDPRGYDPYSRAQVPQQPRRGPGGAPGPQADVWTPGQDSPSGSRSGYASSASAGFPRTERSRSGPASRSTLRPTDGTINPDLDLDELDPSGRARGKSRTGKKKRSRGRTILKWGSIGVSTLVVFALAAGVYVYKTTIGDFKSTALTPKGMTQAALPVDPYGNSAMNILLIGSDTRDTAEDCTLGGDCQGTAAGANADAEIILHVSADRTNATVLSIPRDTETEIPNCSTDSSGNATLNGGSYEGQINSALQNGPECQVAADHALTGITITGYIMFDFGGVVSMSDALGGVQVCVTKAVHDKNSGLDLPAGNSMVEGNTALEFLRTRDSFFDGSDLGREETTHYFFTQMIQSVRSKLNLSSLPALISIGQAAAKSTTVSSNLAGLTNLEGLVNGLNSIPNKDITFVTMPWNLDPTNDARVVVEQPEGNTMFQNIQNDVSYSAAAVAARAAATPAKPAVPTAPASVNDGTVPVGVYNADGVTGRAGSIASALTSDGFSQASAIGDATTAATTDIYYPAGDLAQADAVAAALKIPSAQVQQSTTYSKVSVVVGTDFEAGTTYVISTPAAASGAAVAPPTSYETNADATGECIPVDSGTLTMAHE